MARFQQVIEYVCRRYESAYRLDQSRLGLILYLIDWRSAIERRKPITDIAWRVEEFGPQPDLESSRFAISAVTASPPDFTSLSMNPLPAMQRVDLSAEEISVIEFVISTVAMKSDLELQQLVRSTFPVLTQPKTAPLNLVALAAQYDREYRHAG